MSVCGQSGQTEDESGSEEVTTATAATAAAVRDLYKQKPASKVVRVLTVLAYLLSVSLAAILLSVYYVCVWKSPDLPPLNDTGVELSAQRAHPHEYIHNGTSHNQNFTGGGDSGVSAHKDTGPANVTEVTDASEATTTEQTFEETSVMESLPPLNNSLYIDTNDTVT